MPRNFRARHKIRLDFGALDNHWRPRLRALSPLKTRARLRAVARVLYLRERLNENKGAILKILK